jgi:hypothetical protein
MNADLRRVIDRRLYLQLAKGAPNTREERRLLLALLRLKAKADDNLSSRRIAEPRLRRRLAFTSARDQAREESTALLAAEIEKLTPREA